MNERIRELAVQARQEFLKMPTGYTPEQVGMYPQLMEKFAELIVKECISRIEGCAVETSPDDFVKGYNKGVSKVSSQVKQYFGVEE